MASEGESMDCTGDDELSEQMKKLQEELEMMKESDTDEKFKEDLYAPEKRFASIKTVEEKWKLLPAFLRVRGLVKQHIDSFNYFMDEGMEKIVHAHGTFRNKDPHFEVLFKNVRIGTPRSEERESKAITPQECRLRDITYSAPIYVDIDYKIRKDIQHIKGQEIGCLPIMLGSNRCVLHNMSDEQLAELGECPHDPRGYFIIKGAEKAILIHEQLSSNRIIVEYYKTQNRYRAYVTSITAKTKSQTTVYSKNGEMFLSHNKFNKDINMGIIMKALGAETDMGIMQLVGTDSMYVDGMMPTLIACAKLGIFTREQALEEIAQHIHLRKTSKYTSARSPTTMTPQKKREAAIDKLITSILPHVKIEGSNFRPKQVYLALMMRRIVQAIHDKSTMDDKDYYGNKRLELAGQMIEWLFENAFKQFIARMKTLLQTQLKPTNAQKFNLPIPASSVITTGLSLPIATGNWVIQRFNMNRQGVTMALCRESYIAALGMMTRVNPQFEKTRKNPARRALQGSQWGMVCPSDTPEGENCGLTKNLALMTHITTDKDADPVARIAFDLGVEDLGILAGDELFNGKNALVFVNGKILGIHANPWGFVKKLRMLRRRGVVGAFTSVFFHRTQNSIFIASDGGRVCRPAIIVTDGQPHVTDRHISLLKKGVLTFDDFVNQGLIEYLDVNEENDCRIAYDESWLTAKSTHLEIEPFTVLGAVAGLIPFPHHNQSPRNTYQCAMGKQAMGTIALNQLNRMDKQLLLLVYPQRPLVQTKTIELLKLHEMPAGQNASVMVMSYTGYDIEDAIVLNKASVDRGFGRCIVLKRHVTKVSTQRDRLIYKKDKLGDASALDKDGICSPGLQLNQHRLGSSIMVNKQIPVESASLGGGPGKTMYVSKPDKYKNTIPAMVDKVMLATSHDDLVIKVLTRQTRRPEQGDKFSSRHGQKGVVGIIVDQEDMPFNDLGICPDLIMNPHGFPSRMTVGKMIELLGGKAALLDGKLRDGTAFGGDSVDSIAEALVRHGFSYSGKDYVTSGLTGQPLVGFVFSGPVYYQKLKHMVVDKMFARATGQNVSLTRQPTHGRSRGGGLRIGEMERDVLIAHGTASLLVERMVKGSDEYDIPVCKVCGQIASTVQCEYCKGNSNVTNVKMPYAFKVLLQELSSMNINPRLRLSPM